MKPSTQPILTSLIALVSGLAVISALLILVVNGDSEFSGKFIAISFSLFLYGITGSICWATSRRNEVRGLGIAGVIVAVFAFLIFTIYVLAEPKGVDFIRLTFSSFLLAIAFAHICFLFYLTMRNKYASMTRIITSIFIGLFTLLLVSQVWSLTNSSFFYLGRDLEATTFRIIGSSLVLDLSGTLLVALLNRLNSPTVTLELESEPVPSKPDAPADTFHSAPLG